MITRSIVLHHPRAFQLSLEVLQAPTEELLDASKALLAPFEIVLGLLEALPGRSRPSSRYVDTHRFRKNRTYISSTFSRLHKNTLWKGKSASDENIHMRDILFSRSKLC